jgi:ribosomal-protein-alanine N-acetyltransferase
MTPDALAALHRLAFTDTPRPWSAPEFDALLRAPTTLLATCEGGFALGRIAGPEAELLTLAVHPGRRRQGLGTALVDDFAAQAAGRGAEDCVLEVAVTNAAARALYGRLGFVPVGRRPGYYTRPAAPPVDALVLRKRLAPPKDH